MLKVPARAIRPKRKVMASKWEESKTVCIIDDTLYIDNPKDSTKKILDLIIGFRKVSGYKINVKN